VTILSALDVKNTGSEKVLFIVHINEILKQTKETFERVFPERKNDLGFYNGKEKDKDKKILFASIQTLGKKKTPHHLAPSPKLLIFSS
jgi:superfamily II DNA or RNA helicase